MYTHIHTRKNLSYESYCLSSVLTKGSTLYKYYGSRKAEKATLRFLYSHFIENETF